MNWIDLYIKMESFASSRWSHRGINQSTVIGIVRYDPK